MPDEWIRQWGDPVLHQRARSVRVFDDLLRMQVRRMGERLTEAEGAEGEGYLTSFLQHEIDHLDGVLTLDRAERTERSRAVATLLADHERQLAA